jgi:hypothetical protein
MVRYAVAAAIFVVSSGSTAWASSITDLTYAQALIPGQGCASADGGVTPLPVDTSTANVSACGLSASAFAQTSALDGHLTALAQGATSSSGVLNAQALAGASVRLDDTISITGAGMFLEQAFAVGNASTAPCIASGNINNEVLAGLSLRDAATNAVILDVSQTAYASCTSGDLAFQPVPDLLNLNVGDHLSLSAFVGANISLGGTSTGLADISHSLFFFLTPVTPGASYTTESGNNYAAPAVSEVPEPASLLLMATGLASCIRRRRRAATN